MGQTKIKSSSQLNIDANLDLQAFKVINLAEPTGAQDAATKNYVDSVAQGLSVKASVRAASTANVNLSSPGTSIDGVTLQSGDRVLIKNQTTQSQNGIYIFNGSASAMTRAADFDNWDEIPGAFCFVEEGSSNADTGWVCTADQGGTLGTDTITFAQFSSAGMYTAGNGISISGNVISTNIDINGALEYNSGALRIKLDGITLSRSSAGLKVTDNTFQPLNNTLSAIAGLATTGLIVRTGVGTAATRSVATGPGLKASNADGVSSDPKIDVDTTVITTKSNNVIREVPAGTINGSNTVFTLASTPDSGKELVFLNGILQNAGAGNDYTIAGATITFTTAPKSGDVILVCYTK